MKVSLFLVILSAVASVGLIVFVNKRKTEEAKEEKRGKFHDVKLRVTLDVLREYEDQRKIMEELRTKLATEMKNLESELTNLEIAEKQKKNEADSCLGHKKSLDDELGSLESEMSTTNAELEKQKVSWKEELESLKQQISQRSKVCDFVKKDSNEGRTLCGDKVIDPKAEPPKEEPPKEEPPKAEPPKEEPPKQEPPKAEPPKQEPPKAEPPK